MSLWAHDMGQVVTDDDLGCVLTRLNVRRLGRSSPRALTTDSETTGQREEEHHLNDSADASELGVGTPKDGAVMADGTQFRPDPLVPARAS